MARGNKTKRTNKKHSPYDARVDIFKNFYLRPDSFTFMNARASAMRAGYTENYANKITTDAGPIWFQELIESADYKRSRMLQAAEDNLLKTVESQPMDQVEIKIKHDATKFISERLGKDHYSTRQEVTGKDGKRLFAFKDEKQQDSVSELFKGVQTAPKPAE